MRRDELRVGGGCLGAVGVDLRLGLVNVFDARAGTEKPQLRVGLTALGFRAGERQLGVGGIETREERAGGHASTLADAELEDPAAHRRRDVDLSGLDLPGDTGTIGWRRVLACSRGNAQADQRSDGDVAYGLHGFDLLWCAGSDENARRIVS